MPGGGAFREALGASAAQMLKIAAQPTEQLPPAAIWLLLPHPHPPWPWDGLQPSRAWGRWGWRASWLPGEMEQLGRHRCRGPGVWHLFLWSSRSHQPTLCGPSSASPWFPTPIPLHLLLLPQGLCTSHSSGLEPAFPNTHGPFLVLLWICTSFRVAKTKYCKLSDLKQQKSMRSGFWRPRV